MKYDAKKFKNLALGLKELEPFVRNGRTLHVGRGFKNFGGLLPREVLTNWLLCAVANSVSSPEQFTFTSDPTGGDGIIVDTKTGETWKTE